MALCAQKCEHGGTPAQARSDCLLQYVFPTENANAILVNFRPVNDGAEIIGSKADRNRFLFGNLRCSYRRAHAIRERASSVNCSKKSVTSSCVVRWLTMAQRMTASP